jgi:MFS family permease
MRSPTGRQTITAIFFLNGAVFSAWYARLPAIQEKLDLGPGEIGVALLGAPAALLVAQPAVGALVARHGSRPLVAAAPAYMLAVALPALAVDFPTLVLAVVAVGAANGALDIAMNAQGLEVERRAGRNLFNSLHAGFSFGVLAGAAAAGLIAGLGMPPLPHLIAWGAAGALVALALAPGLVADAPAAGSDAPYFARPSRHLAVLGVIAFCALLAEGAVFDWSGIFLARDAGASEGVAALGLAAFALAMGVGRLGGDAVATRLGVVVPVRAGAALAAAGLALGLALATPSGGIVGFALMGLGLSVVFPLALRTAGRAGAAGPALAAVSTVGYTGFLAGPPLIGLVGELIGLRGALALVCLACAVAALLAHQIGRSPSLPRHATAYAGERPR